MAQCMGQRHVAHSQQHASPGTCTGRLLLAPVMAPPVTSQQQQHEHPHHEQQRNHHMRHRQGGRSRKRVLLLPCAAEPASSSATTFSSLEATATASAVVVPQTSTSGREEDDVLIEFRDVHKAFGDKPILQGASFKIRRGEAVGIIGASGTGKSTTLRLAAGLLAPDRGEILIKGRLKTGLLSDSAEDMDHLRVGMVFQNAALFDSLTVGQNVGFLLYEHSDLPPHRIKDLVADSLGKVGLRGVEDLYPAELSGGMKKRVALARAVVSDQRSQVEQVIMYDEPTAGLDPVASTVVEDLMRSLHMTGQGQEGNGSSGGSNGGGVAESGSGGGNGTGNGAAAGSKGGISSYIVVTHQHSTIRRAVDRIIFLHKGKVVWEGTVQEFDTTDEPIVRQFAEGSLEGPISYV